MSRRIVPLICGLLALLLVATGPTWAATPDGFIREIGNKAFMSLSPANLSEEERIDRFRNLLNEAFDLRRIGRFVLGVHWRRASEAQRDEFLDLFEKFVVRAYANRFRDLSDKEFRVRQARELSGMESLVFSEVVIPGQAPVKVNWKVRDFDGTFKIVDVVVEGVSMSITQRDEFAAVIRQNGGVDGLIDALRRKTSD